MKERRGRRRGDKLLPDFLAQCHPLPSEEGADIWASLAFHSSAPSHLSLPEDTLKKKAHMFLQVQPSTTLSGLPLSLGFLGQILLAQVSHTNVGPTQSHHHPSGRPVLMAQLIQAVNTRESVNT